MLLTVWMTSGGCSQVHRGRRRTAPTSQPLWAWSSMQQVDTGGSFSSVYAAAARRLMRFLFAFSRRLCSGCCSGYGSSGGSGCCVFCCDSSQGERGSPQTSRRMCCRCVTPPSGLLQAPAAFGLVSFLMHAGLDKKFIQGHLLAFSAAAPLVAISTYFILQAVRKTNKKRGGAETSQLHFLFPHVFCFVSAVWKFGAEAARCHGCRNALLSRDLPLCGHGARAPRGQPDRAAPLPAPAARRSGGPPPAALGTHGERHSHPGGGTASVVGSWAPWRLRRRLQDGWSCKRRCKACRSSSPPLHLPFFFTCF